MSYNVVEGSVIRFYTAKPFTSLAGTTVNPDVVTFSYQVQGSAAVTFTWTNGQVPPDPTNTIVNTSTGNFQADIQTLGLAGTWTWQWSGQPGVSGLDTTKTSIIDDGEVIVSPKAI